MEESSRFLSLSGLSGISAGAVAIAGATVAYFGILDKNNPAGSNPLIGTGGELTGFSWSLAIVASATLLCALFSAWYFTWKKSKSKNGIFWTTSAKKMATSLGSILLVGGILSLILVVNALYMLIPGITLTFYGIALLHASKYSHRDILYLAWLQIGVGLLACLLPEAGMLLWTIGFGVLHIIYGTIMYLKYDRQNSLS